MTAEKEKWDVMISYNWKTGKEHANDLYKVLTENRYKVCIDKKMMAYDLCRGMANGVANSKIILLLISEEYKNSHNCEKEYTYADELKKKIIPIYVENYKPPPSSKLAIIISEMIYYKLYENKKENMEKILIAVENHIGKRTLIEDQESPVLHNSIPFLMSSEINSSERYPMTREKLGILHIFNNLSLDPKKRLKYAALNAVRSFKKTFGEVLKFEVKVHTPKDFGSFNMELIDAIKHDENSQFSIFGIVMIANGDQAKFYGPIVDENDNLTTGELKNLFDENKNLIGIPKIVLTECFRGARTDLKKELPPQASANSKSHRKGSDIFWGTSKVKKNLSIIQFNKKHPEEAYSPWVTILCNVIENFYKTSDLYTIYKILQDIFENEIVELKRNEIKNFSFQMPDIITDTLIKKLFLCAPNFTGQESDHLTNEINSDEDLEISH